MKKQKPGEPMHTYFIRMTSGQVYEVQRPSMKVLRKELDEAWERAEFMFGIGGDDAVNIMHIEYISDFILDRGAE